MHDRWRPFWILRSGKFRPPLQKRHRSLFFYKYLKLPKTTVKPYLQKVGHGIMVSFGPTNMTLIHFVFCIIFCNISKVNRPRLHINTIFFLKLNCQLVGVTCLYSKGSVVPRCSSPKPKARLYWGGTGLANAGVSLSKMDAPRVGKSVFCSVEVFYHNFRASHSPTVFI